MPNIFNKEPHQLKYLARQRGNMDARQFRDEVVSLFENPRLWDHDFSRRNFRNDAEANVQAIGLISNNQEALMTEVEEVVYEQFKLPEYIPINSGVPEGATSFSYKVIDRKGEGKFINKDGSNVEGATVSAGKIVFNIEYAGIQPQWTLQELRESLFAGIPIDGLTLRAGAEGALAHIQKVGFLGDSDVGFAGLVNNPDITKLQGVSIPNFGSATSDEIVKFINDMIISVGQSTKEIFYDSFGTNPLMFVLPTEAYDIISTKQKTEYSDRTILEWLEARNAWTTRTGQPIQFKSLHYMKGAGDSDSDRVAMYPLNSSIIEMAIPIMPRIIGVDDSSRYLIKTPMEYSMSGLNVKRGSLCLYADGIMG